MLNRTLSVKKEMYSVRAFIPTIIIPFIRIDNLPYFVCTFFIIIVCHLLCSF